MKFKTVSIRSVVYIAGITGIVSIVISTCKTAPYTAELYVKVF